MIPSRAAAGTTGVNQRSGATSTGGGYVEQTRGVATVPPPSIDAASDEDWDDDGDDESVDGPLDGGTHVERDPDDPRAVPPSDADFEFARASAVPNVGEDIKASARHRWRWADLTTAEADGAAEGDGGT